MRDDEAGGVPEEEGLARGAGIGGEGKDGEAEEVDDHEDRVGEDLEAVLALHDAFDVLLEGRDRLVFLLKGHVLVLDDLVHVPEVAGVLLDDFLLDVGVLEGAVHALPVVAVIQVEEDPEGNGQEEDDDDGYDHRGCFDAVHRECEHPCLPPVPFSFPASIGRGPCCPGARRSLPTPGRTPSG